MQQFSDVLDVVAWVAAAIAFGFWMQQVWAGVFAFFFLHFVEMLVRQSVRRARHEDHSPETSTSRKGAD